MKRISRKQLDSAVTVELECMTCQARKSVELSQEKFKELSESWKIRQACDACGKSTDWTFAQAADEIGEEEDFWEWITAIGEYFEAQGAPPQNERRRERRINVHVPLRISEPGGREEEEVTSENISKSGFAFSSLRVYEVGKTIQVTVQTPGAQSPMTKTATIVRAAAGTGGSTLFGARLES
jgi:hypothetical protein